MQHRTARSIGFPTFALKCRVQCKMASWTLTGEMGGLLTAISCVLFSGQEVKYFIVIDAGQVGVHTIYRSVATPRRRCRRLHRHGALRRAVVRENVIITPYFGWVQRSIMSNHTVGYHLLSTGPMSYCITVSKSRPSL